MDFIRLLVLCAVSLFIFSVNGTYSQYVDGDAMTALYFSKASYCDASAITNWSCPSCNEHESFKVMNIYTNTTTGTQGFSGVSADRIVIAFRGSQNIQNWINNLISTHTEYPNPNCSKCSVHSGFLNSYNSLRVALLRDVQSLVRSHPAYPILVTGHSLGGAMATLAAAELASSSFAGGRAARVELYTFGAPRVGNRAFADWNAALFCSGGHISYRLTHDKDVVPHLPSYYSDFIQTTNEVWYEGNTDAGPKFCRDINGSVCGEGIVDEDPNCSDSVLPISIADHLFYLGMCTSCVCSTKELMEMQNARLSEEMKLKVATDFFYIRLKRTKSNPSAFNVLKKNM